MTEMPPELRALLACPRCRGPLADGAPAAEPALLCRRCQVAYPVEQGIPVLLSERARPLSGG